MYCPYCKHTDSRVVDSRTTDDGAAIRRRRQCTSCARRFTTVETTTISVIKRSAEINAHEVGLTILEPLSKLDAVAYLRFASVYQAFENLEDFEEAIARLREDRINP